jgi:hypothetical protein
MTVTLLEPSASTRHTWAECLSEAAEAAGAAQDARARAEVARFLRMPGEALAYDLAAHRHEERVRQACRLGQGGDRRPPRAGPISLEALT